MELNKRVVGVKAVFDEGYGTRQTDSIGLILCGSHIKVERERLEK